jgi:hypothetical protein
MELILALLTSFSLYIANITEYDVHNIDPSIAFVEGDRFKQIYMRENGIHDEDRVKDLAAYFDGHTIFLPSQFDPADVLHQSDLLHEVVHAVQRTNKPDLPNWLAEQEAYGIQARFLKENGREDVATIIMLMSMLMGAGPTPDR